MNKAELRVLAVGPEGKVITGQQVSFSYLDLLKDEFNINCVYYFGGGIFSSLFFMLKFIFIILKTRPHIVYFTCSRSVGGFLRDMFIILVSNLLHARTVNHLHGADLMKFYESLGKNSKCIVRFVYSKIDAHIILHQSMCDQLDFLNCKPRIYVISNCSSFSENNDGDFIREESTLRLLYMSNWIPSKGLDEVIIAFKSVLPQLPGAELHICGSDTFDTSFTLYIRELIKDVPGVSYHGVVSGRIKYDLLSECNVSVLLSKYPTEAQPISIIEGICFGHALLISNHNYLPYLFEEAGTVLIDTKNSKDVEAALITIADNLKKLRARSRSTSNRYSIENYISAISSCFKEVAYEL